MNIAIRVDASLTIGTGHVMRCLALADGLAESGANIVFYSRKQPGSLEKFIEQKGYRVILLAQPAKLSVPKHGADYEAWLQFPEKTDAKDFLKKAFENQPSLEWVIVDHYGIGRTWEIIIQSELRNIKILAIDDLVRNHKVDFLVDHTLDRKKEDYEIDSTIKHFLVGSEYALLRPEFNKYREYRIERKSDATGLRLLISMGGVDTRSSTIEILKSLLPFEKTGLIINSIDVVLSSTSPEFESVNEIINSNCNVRLHTFVGNMASLMSQMDIAIGAPGVSAWERCCLGLPSVLVPIAENQKHNAESLLKTKSVELVELNNLSALIPALVRINNHLSVYRQKSLSICDGLGVSRVRQYIFPKHSKNDNPIYLRLARETDIEKVFEWQCLPETRRFSRNTKVPSCSEHQSWMQDRLVNPYCYFYIIQMKTLPVGVVRLDRCDLSTYEISIFVDPQFFGLGIAVNVLSLIKEMHPNISILATVLPENIASRKLFMKAGFRIVDEQSFIYEGIK